jgi:hypothetical protein
MEWWMTDSRFLASGLFAMSLFAVPGIDVPNVAIEGLALASGVDLRAGACNEVRVFVRAATTWQGNARVQLVLREVGGDLTFSGTRAVTLAAGTGRTLAFEDIPVRKSGRHLVVASVSAGDTTEAVLAANVEGECARG